MLHCMTRIHSPFHDMHAIRGSKVQRFKGFHVFAPNVKGYIKMYNSKAKNVNEYMYNINHDHNETKKIDCDGWRQ